MRSAHSLNFRPEKALLIALVAVINDAGVPLRLVVLLITPDYEGHRLHMEAAIYYARDVAIETTDISVCISASVQRFFKVFV